MLIIRRSKPDVTYFNPTRRTPLVSALRSQMQADLEFRASLVYRMRQEKK